jgi:hypothetical protein
MVRFFGVVDVTRGLGTFIGVLPILIIGTIMTCIAFTYACSKRMENKISSVQFEMTMMTPESAVTGSMESQRLGIPEPPIPPMRSLKERFLQSGMVERWGVPQLPEACSPGQPYKKISAVHLRHLAGMVRDFVPLTLGLGFAIWFTEDTLRISNVQVDGNLLSTGQMLPLIVGMVNCVGVFTGWLDDRALNAVGERIWREKMRCKAAAVEEGKEGEVVFIC